MPVESESNDTEQIVVSLCDHSGNMLTPWASVGYECYAVDLKNDETTEYVNGNGQIHYVQADVRDWTPPHKDVRIGFGFPPCTDLAVSGARWFQEKGLGALAEAIELVAACHDTLTSLDCPWLIENPKSTLSTHWRSPDYRFNPYEYDAYTARDERYTKETWLWTGGGFRMPRTDGVREHEADDRIHKMPPSDDRSEKRAETPTGFARAVFLAHEQPDEYAIPGTGTQQDTLVTDGGTISHHKADDEELVEAALERLDHFIHRQDVPPDISTLDDDLTTSRDHLREFLRRQENGNSRSVGAGINRGGVDGE